MKYLELTTNPLIIPNTVSPNEKYESRKERIDASLMSPVAGLREISEVKQRREGGTYENPVDFFIPAIIVDIAIRSMASLVSLLRPNIEVG